MDILYRKTCLRLGVFLVTGIFISSTSYCMDEDKDKNVTSAKVQKEKDNPTKKKENKEIDFMRRIEFLTKENLEDDDSNLSSSVTDRKDKWWVNPDGKRVYLEAK